MPRKGQILFLKADMDSVLSLLFLFSFAGGLSDGAFGKAHCKRRRRFGRGYSEGRKLSQPAARRRFSDGARRGGGTPLCRMRSYENPHDRGLRYCHCCGGGGTYARSRRFCEEDERRQSIRGRIQRLQAVPSRSKRGFSTVGTSCAKRESEWSLLPSSTPCRRTVSYTADEGKGLFVFRM